MPGPPKTPTAILRQRGSWRADERSEPPVSSDPPIKPAKLPKIASEAWNHFERILRARGVVAHGDGFVLERLVMLYDRIHELQNICKKRGKFTETRPGNIKKSPWFVALQETERDFNKLLQQFGLTPSSRPDAAPLDTPGAGSHADYFND